LPYQWRGQALAESGFYYDSLQTVDGCDSTLTLTLTVNPTYVNNEEVVICASELPYQWRNFTLTESGTRTVNMQTVDGCDSTLTLTLTVNPTYLNNEEAVICVSEAPYQWRGRALTASGIYYDSLQTVDGCDSVYALTLTINPASYSEDTVTICASETPYLWRGQPFTTTGVYADTIPNAYGCQDIFVLVLTVNSTYGHTVYDTICLGDAYQQYGFDTLPNQYGTLYLQQMLTTVSGCDSIVNLQLTVNRTYLTPTMATTCENVLYEWRGEQYAEAGVYYDNLQSTSGCDSVFVLYLAVNPSFEIHVEDSAVRQHEYNNYGLSFIPEEAGDYEYTIQNYTVDGCDSIVYLTLHVANNDGVEDYEPVSQCIVYPNPTVSIVNIEGVGMTNIFVYDLNGNLVGIVHPESETRVSFDVSGLASGQYMLKIDLHNGRSVTKKLLKK